MPPCVLLLQITLSKLQQLTPLFSTITQSQVDVLATALNVLPQHAITKLTFLLQAFGSVTDVVVTAKQSKGLLPNYSSSSRGAAVNGVRFGPFGFGRKLKATACVAADKVRVAGCAGGYLVRTLPRKGQLFPQMSSAHLRT